MLEPVDLILALSGAVPKAHPRKHPSRMLCGLTNCLLFCLLSWQKVWLGPGFILHCTPAPSQKVQCWPLGLMKFAAECRLLCRHGGGLGLYNLQGHSYWIPCWNFRVARLEIAGALGYCLACTASIGLAWGTGDL